MLIAWGARVTLVDLSGDAVAALAAQLPAGTSIPFAADVTKTGQMQAAVATTVEKFGRLDVVWANAGIANDPPVTLATAGLASYERVIEVDLFGVVRTIKPTLAHVIKNRGQVVVTGSGYSMLNAVLNSAYGAAKAGVEMFTRSLRAELAPHGASASVLYPGWTRTAITHSTQDDELLNRLFRQAYRGPLGKFFEPETVAAGLVRGLHKRAPAHLRTTSVGGIFRLAWRRQPADGRRPRQRQDHARPAPPDRAPMRGKQKPGRRACRAGHGRDNGR